YLLSQIKSYFFFVERRLCDKRNNGSFEFSNVSFYVFSHIFHDLIAHFYSISVKNVFQDRETSFIIGLLQLCRQSPFRSEEHTSELQSRENLVCRLLLEKKNSTTHSR